MTGTLLLEGFDPYGAVADMNTSGWTITSSPTLGASGFTPFSVGQSFRITGTGSSSGVYNWNSNESTVYGSVFYANNGATSSSNYTYFSFRDGATAQCTLRWNMDGSLSLYTGGPTGTLIVTTTSMYTAGIFSSFVSFQFKIVIHNTAGSIEIRVNGSATNSITQTNVNTRGGTTNAYVNTLLISAGSGDSYFDDLYLTTTGWTGEMRALQQRPTTVVTPNFSVFGPTTQTLFGSSGINLTANTTYYRPFVATATCLVNSFGFQMNANLTGNMKFAIYDSTGSSGAPGTSLATSSAVNNPTTSTNTATFSSPPTLVVNTSYYLAIVQDATANVKGTTVALCYTSATSYASFPVNSPSFSAGPGSQNIIGGTLNITVNNAAGVQDLTQDGDTSYIYTSGATVEDKYHLSSIPTTYAVSAVQYYAMWKKTDAGYRTASLSVDANGSGDTNLVTTVPPTIGTYTYTIKTMELDPTGAAWTPTNVNNALLGVTAGS